MRPTRAIRSYSYDATGRSISITNGGNTIYNQYNGLGERVRKASSATVLYFVYDESGHLLSEYDLNNKMVREYIWLGDRVVGMYSKDVPNTLLRVHTDHLGTPRAVTQGNGTTRKVLWRFEGDAFGTAQATNPTATVLTMPLRMPGQYFDSEVGTSYNYFRDYDASTGRYVESDSIGLLGGNNTYGYVGGSPVGAIDPYGLMGSNGYNPPSAPCTCPSPPAMPEPAEYCPFESELDKNIKSAKSHYNPKWFYSQVRNKGPWDYKQQGSGFQNFGNFNYGAAGHATGFPDSVLLRMAGWAQTRAGTSKPEWGKPNGSPPYGDDPNDQTQIRAGIQYARCRCK